MSVVSTTGGEEPFENSSRVRSSGTMSWYDDSTPVEWLTYVSSGCLGSGRDSRVHEKT